MIRVLPRRMQYADTNHPRRVIDVGVPDGGEEAHCGRGEGVVAGETELGREDPGGVGRGGRAGEECFPGEEVVFREGVGGYAVGGVEGEGAVFLEEALGGEGGRVGHGLGEGLERKGD